MKRYYIEAVQLTDATFDAPHPNPERVPGVTYHPETRTATFAAGKLGTPTTAEVGDWIVQIATGVLHRVDAETFTRVYREVA